MVTHRLLGTESQHLWKAPFPLSLWSSILALLLTHGLQLSQKLLPGPLQPLSPVAADGTKDGAAALSTILEGWDVQVVHKDDVRVLRAEGHTRRVMES